MSRDDPRPGLAEGWTVAEFLYDVDPTITAIEGRFALEYLSEFVDVIAEITGRTADEVMATMNTNVMAGGLMEGVDLCRTSGMTDWAEFSNQLQTVSDELSKEREAEIRRLASLN